MDDVNLPPLPEETVAIATIHPALKRRGPIESPWTDLFDANKMRDYARAAVLAERERLTSRIVLDLEAANGGIYAAFAAPGLPNSYERGRHSGMLHALRIVRAALDAQPAPAQEPAPMPFATWPRVYGTGRVLDNPQALLVVFARPPTDDELRAFDDAIKGHGTAGAANDARPARPAQEAQPAAHDALLAAAKRLEVAPHGIDGIAARDETIRMLEAERDALRSTALDLALFVRRLIARLRRVREGGGSAVGDEQLAGAALKYLRQRGMEGTPLRGEDVSNG